MTAIYWKELRENIKWALIGFAAYALALAYAWSKARDLYQGGQGYAYDSICHSQILMITLFGSACVGTALGFLQLIPEQIRDRWAFLVHRPITMRQLYLGKAAAGLTLYALAVVLPFMALSVIASRPGATPGPFYWGMMLPGLADIATGSCFYFLALLCAARNARWFGSKLVPLLAGISLAAYETRATESGPAFFMIALAFVVFAMAAGVALTQSAGTGKRTPGKRIPLLTVLFASYLIVISALMAIPNLLTGQQYGNDYSYYGIMDDGEIVIFHRKGEENFVTKLDGTQLKMSPGEMEKYENRKLDENYLQVKKEPELFLTGDRSYRYARHWFEPDKETDRGRWFYLGDQGYFVRYSALSRQPNGYLGTNGFSEEAPLKQYQFPGLIRVNSEPWNRRIYVFDHQAYWIDLTEQEVHLLEEHEDPKNLLGSTTVWSNYRESNEMYLGAVLSNPDRLLTFYKPDGTRILGVHIPLDPKSYPQINLTKSLDSQKMYVRVSPPWRRAQELPLFIYEYGSDASLLRTQELQPIKNTPYIENWTRLMTYPSLPLGVHLYDLAKTRIKASRGDKYAEWRWKALRDNKVRFWERILVTAGIGMCGMFIGLRRLRAHKFSKAEYACWLPALILGGIPGLLAFWTLYEWPSQVCCDSCKSKRRTDLPHCEHCGAGWPEAGRDGTEIFTPSPTT